MTRIAFEIEDELSKRRHEPSPEIVLNLAHKVLWLCFLSRPFERSGIIIPSTNHLHEFTNVKTENVTFGDLVELRKFFERSSRTTVFVRKNGRRTNKDNGIDGIIIPCVIQLRFKPHTDEDVHVYEFTCRASERGVSVVTLTQSPKLK